jgi:haloalkane dehalogenase
MILEKNAFLTEMLPFTVAGGLADEDLAVYLEPYPTPESRRPLLQWPRSMPLGGEPAEVVARIEQYDAWLAASADVPKLLLAFEPGPGAMMGPELVDWCAATIAGLEIAQLGPAGHHAPEDQPEAIAAAIRAWTERHQLR